RTLGRPANSSPSRVVRGVRVSHAPGVQLRSRQREALRSGLVRGGREPMAPDPLARFGTLAGRNPLRGGSRAPMASAVDLLAVLLRLCDLLPGAVRSRRDE